MNITLHKMPIILSTIVLMMGLLYACPDADSNGDSTTPPHILQAEDITYNSIAKGTEGTVAPTSETITNFSGLAFVLESISTHTGTQTLPAIAEDGTITTTPTTSAGSYRVTIAPNGQQFTGDPITVDFYVTVKAANIGDLDTKLKQAITEYGLTGDFNYIDTSAVKTMSYLFKSGHTPGTGAEDSTRTYVTNFNGDISKWDVSSVTNFAAMFWATVAFNQDIGDWTVSSGTSFGSMFNTAKVFNQDIGRWDVQKATNFSFMFSEAPVFNQDISKWNVSSGTTFKSMFEGAAKFDQNLSEWKVDASDDKQTMFARSGITNPNKPAWYNCGFCLY